MENKSFEKLSREEGKTLRREEAAERQAEHNKLTILEKIKKLDMRLGPNVGAKKERAKLKSLLEAEASAEETKKKATAKKAETKKPKTKKKAKKS
jgi:hypothetical protein